MMGTMMMAVLVAVALVDFAGIATFGYVTVRGLRRSDPISAGVGALIVLACAASLSTIPMPVATGVGVSTGVEG